MKPTILILFSCVFASVSSGGYTPQFAMDAAKALHDSLNDYEIGLKPPAADQKSSLDPVQVKVDVYLTEAWHKGSKVYLMGYLRRNWTDSRLANPEDPPLDLVLSHAKVLDSIWTPDLFIVNGKKDVIHEGGITLKTSTGALETSEQLKIKSYCPVSYEELIRANGVANCTIKIESFMHTTDVLTLAWKDPNGSKFCSVSSKNIVAVKTSATRNTVGSKTYSSLILNVQVKTGITADVAKYLFKQAIAKD